MIDFNKQNQEVKIDENFNPINYKITFKDRKDIDKILEKLNNEIENYKQYKKWLKEYHKLYDELNSCKI